MTELLYQGHGSYRLTSEHGAVVYIDPFAGEGYDKPADLVLVSHEHSDHNQVSRVHLKPDGKVLRAANLIDGASYGGCLVKDVLVKATAAYNKNHPKSECVGFLLSTGGKKLYFACDTSETEEMKREADKLIDRNHIKYVIFDFENTDFMDSSGIGVIMGRYKTISLIGGEVWAVHANARIRKILTLSGVTKIMQIYEEEEE